MLKTKTVRVLTLVMAGFCLVLLPMISGCSKHPSKEELTKLEEAKKAAQSAEKELQAKKTERGDLQKNLDSKQRLLNDTKADRDAVRDCVTATKANP